MMPLMTARPRLLLARCCRSSTAQAQACLNVAPAYPLAHHSSIRVASNSPPRYALPIGDRFAPPEFDHSNRLRPTANTTIPIVRRTTEPTWPAVSSPEACRTPAARVCGIVLQAAGVRQPLAEPDDGECLRSVRWHGPGWITSRRFRASRC